MALHYIPFSARLLPTPCRIDPDLNGQRVFILSDLLAAARAKHGSEAGLTAAARQWEEREAELAAGRPQGLEGALKARGVELRWAEISISPASVRLPKGTKFCVPGRPRWGACTLCGLFIPSTALLGPQ